MEKTAWSVCEPSCTGMTPVVVRTWRARQKLAIQVTHVGRQLDRLG